MKLNEKFIRHQFDSRTVIVPATEANFRGLIQGNKTFSAIAECLTHDTTEEEIVDTLCARFDGDREDVKADATTIYPPARTAPRTSSAPRSRSFKRCGGYISSVPALI